MERQGGFTAVILSTLCEADFLQMQQLEQQFYSSEYITPYRTAWDLYKRFPYTTFAAAENGRIAGFLNLFPVKDAVWRQIKSGQYNDKALSVEDVADVLTKDAAPLHMFLSCIVISSERRGQGLTRLLLSAAAAYYRPYSERCDDVITDNVTEEGRRFSERYGFTALGETDHRSQLYIQSYRQFESRVLRR